MTHICVIQYTIPYQFVIGLHLNILNLQMRQKWETSLLEMFLEKKCFISCSTCYGNTCQNTSYLQSTIHLLQNTSQLIDTFRDHRPIIDTSDERLATLKKKFRLVQKLGRGGKFWRFLKAERRFLDIWIQGTLHRQVALISYNNRPMSNQCWYNRIFSTTKRTTQTQIFTMKTTKI